MVARQAPQADQRGTIGGESSVARPVPTWCPNGQPTTVPMHTLKRDGGLGVGQFGLVMRGLLLVWGLGLRSLWFTWVSWLKISGFGVGVGVFRMVLGEDLQEVA